MTYQEASDEADRIATSLRETIRKHNAQAKISYSLILREGQVGNYAFIVYAQDPEFKDYVVLTMIEFDN